MTVESLFLDESAKTLRQLTSRIEACFGRLTDEQIWARGGENENAIGNLTLHLAGNVRQWIIASLGGAPDLRKRDEEFAARGGRTVQELISHLKATVDEAAAIIASLDTAKLTREYTIQKYQVSGLTAVYHVVEHFAQHTGQVIFATKMLTGEDLGFYSHLKTVRPAGSAQ
jgi:uncharacterized damage-inducible protein DinB